MEDLQSTGSTPLESVASIPDARLADGETYKENLYLHS